MMIKSIVLVVVLLTAGCAAQQRTIQRYNDMAIADCQNYGFKPGTDAFAYCLKERGYNPQPNAGLR